MNLSPATVLQALIVSGGLAAVPGGRTAKWPCYISNLPDGADTPDDAIAVYDTVGFNDGRLMRGGEQIEHPGTMIRVRAVSYTMGYLKILSIADWLSAQLRKEVTIGTSVYVFQNIKRVSTILPNGPESGSTRREHFTLNLLLTVSQKQ